MTHNELRGAVRELRRAQLFNDPITGEIAKKLVDDQSAREFVGNNKIEFTEKLPGDFYSYYDFSDRSDFDPGDHEVRSNNVDGPKDGKNLKQLSKGLSKQDKSKIAELYARGNPLFDAWKNYADDVLFNCRLIAMGVDRLGVEAIKPYTGILYNTLDLDGPRLGKSDYHFGVKVPQYYQYLAKGRKPNAMLYGKTFSIPVDRVYNRSEKDNYNAAKYGGMTFRKYTTSVALYGVAERDFVRKMMTILWDQHQSRIISAEAKLLELL